MPERPPIDRARVEHVARLASLSLEPGEVDAMARELGRIVQYVETLSQLDTSGVPPTTGGYPPDVAAPPADGALRPDDIRPGLSHDEALAQAPEQAGGGFAVPRFLDSPKTAR